MGKLKMSSFLPLTSFTVHTPSIELFRILQGSSSDVVRSNMHVRIAMPAVLSKLRLRRVTIKLLIIDPQLTTLAIFILDRLLRYREAEAGAGSMALMPPYEVFLHWTILSRIFPSPLQQICRLLVALS